MDDKLTLILFLTAPPLAGELLLLFWLFRSRRVSGKPGWRRVLLFNVVSVVILTVLSFAGGELYYRYIYDTTDSIAYTKVARQWVQRYIVLNAAGFRDNVQYALLRPPGKRRISFLGDSFTAGHGVKSVEDRFPNLLRAAHPEWEVHVLAKLGWDTGMQLQELARCRREGYQFDCVVLVYCLNDVADLFPEWSAALRRLEAEAQRANWLRRHSFFIDILYHRYRVSREPHIRNYYGFVKLGYQRQPWEVQQQRLTEVRDSVAAYGGRLVVVTFPFLQSVEKDYEYRWVHEELGRFWERSGVPHLDLLKEFEGQRAADLTVNSFDPHPNERANAIAAQALEAFLLEQLQRPPAATEAR